MKRSFVDISGDVEAKRRTLKILVFGIHPAGFGEMGGWFRFVRWMIPFPIKGYAGRKPCTGNRSVRFDEVVEATKSLL